MSSEHSSPSGADTVPLSVRAAASWSWRVLLIAAAVAAFLWLLASLKTIVVPVAIALLVTVLLAPVRRSLQRWHLSKGLATAVSIVGLIVLVGGLVTLAGTSIVSGFQDLADQAVEGFRQFTTWLAEGPLQLDAEQLSGYGQQLQSSLVESSGIVSGALGAATTVGHVFVGALIALFCTIFFLLDGRTIWTWLVNLLPVRARENVHQAGRRGLVTLSAYVRTQILVAFVDAVGIGVGSVFFVPALALPIGILVFIGSFVPIIGAIVTGAIATAVVLVAKGWIAALIMLGIVLLVQQAESHILQPFLMGHAVSLHPVAVVLVVAAGSLAAGIVGALFAVPLAAVLNTVLLYFHGHDKFPELGTEDHLPLLRKRSQLPGTLLWSGRGSSQGATTTGGTSGSTIDLPDAPASPATDAGPAGENR
ncbi:AI-2E family transporter [Krasilnikoviella flava]|uniref:Predicted PurR-regulated permease PerM n=1 Tax=Krasilnikoviella flava TaxID=526729 RepID=A0A1T5ICI2_9MICO|nr:AI-2E family transporter [Krasilnikoviella flava]SKC36815.1 Predicted PurR-regulated permease PerM [Krasilnikoviella flava]